MAVIVALAAIVSAPRWSFAEESDDLTGIEVVGGGAEGGSAGLVPVDEGVEVAGPQADGDPESNDGLLLSTQGESEGSPLLSAQGMSAADYWNKVNAFINDGRYRHGATGWDCYAYASAFASYMYGSTPRGGAQHNSATTIQSGDIVVGQAHNTNGSLTQHWFVVLERDGNSLWTAEGGMNGTSVYISNRYSISGYNIADNYGRGFDFWNGYHFDTGGATTRRASADRQPVGHIDVCEGGGGTIHVKGWAYDPDVPSASIDVHLYFNDFCIGAVPATLARSDVNNAFGISGNHGFDYTVATTMRGNVKVVTYAINNKTDGGNPSLPNGAGVRDITVNVTTPTSRNGTVTELPTDTAFVLIPACSEHRAVTFGSSTNGAGCYIQGGENGVYSTAFQFKFQKHSSGSYGIQWVRDPNYFMHVSEQTNTHMNIVAWQSYGNNNSLWIPEKTSDGYWAFRNAGYGTYLDVYGARDALAVGLVHWPGDNTTAEKFHLVPVNKSLAASDVKVTYPDHITWTDTNTKPNITVSYLGITLKEGEDYTISCRDNGNGTMAVTISGRGGTPQASDLRGYRGYYTGSRTVNIPVDNEPPVIRSVKVVEDSAEKLVVDVVATDDNEVKEVQAALSDLLGETQYCALSQWYKCSKASSTTWRFTVDKVRLTQKTEYGDYNSGLAADAHRLYFWANDAAGNSSKPDDVLKWGQFYDIYDDIAHVDFDLQLSAHANIKVGESVTASELFGKSSWVGYQVIQRSGMGLEHISMSTDQTKVTGISEGTCWMFMIHNKRGSVLCAKIVVGPELVNMSGVTVSSISDQAYKGVAIKPALTVKHGSTTLKSGVDYTISYSNNTNVGTATATITGKGNYTGTKSVSFKIVAASIGSATISAIANQTYTGSAIKPVPTVKMGSSILKSGTDYTLSYSNNTGVGTATVTVTGKGNYKGTKTATFKIVYAKGFFLDADPSDNANHGFEVDWMGRAGISTGWEVVGGREFRGLKNVTRCDFAAFLYRMADLSDDGKRNDSIALSATEAIEVLSGVSDCTARTSHVAEVAWMIKSGISEGWADKGKSTVSFRPMASVARQDMAAFLYRFADIRDNGKQDKSLKKGPETVTFSDVRHGDSGNHAPEVEWLASSGVTKGWDMKDGTFEFRGLRNVARQDMAAFMYRLNEYLDS